MVFPLMLANKNLDAFLVSLMCAKCSAHLKILDSVILIIFEAFQGNFICSVPTALFIFFLLARIPFTSLSSDTFPY